MPGPFHIFVPHCSDLLTDHLPHGDGLIAHGFLTSLARRGHRLHVVAHRVELRQPLHPNISLHVIPLRRLRGVRSRLEYMFRVRCLMQQLKKSCAFDLIHQLNPVFTGVSLALLGSGLPLVLGTYVARWPEDPDAWSWGGGWAGGWGGGWAGGWAERVAARGRDLVAALQQRRADALLLTTPAAWNRLPNPAAVRSRIHPLPHGIDTELFSPHPEWQSEKRVQAEQRKPSILFLANVLQRKGIFTLIAAFPAVAEKFPDCRLRVAGAGPDLAEARNCAARLGCSAQIEFLGHQERAHAPELYRDCSVYCLPSFGEPYGTTVVEAMSCARSLVVTDSGALPHLVHSSGGLRVPAGHPKALAQALIQLLGHPDQRIAMGKYNRHLVESKMSWEMVAEQLERVYEITLRRQSRPGWERNLSSAPGGLPLPAPEVLLSAGQPGGFVGREFVDQGFVDQGFVDQGFVDRGCAGQGSGDSE
jgi:glycosyltransferase involved in cell wall biosynthesis